MNYFFLILLSLFLNTLYSQNLKSYSGTYKKGTATYQYYENTNNEKILNGDFSYTSNDIEIKGKFENNIKTGEWIYSRKNREFNDNTIFIKGEYIKGLKNGTWIFNRYFITKGKKEEYNVTVNFLNDVLIGPIDFPNVKGQFSNDGKFIGKWILKYNDEESIVEFEDNIVTKFTEKSLIDNKLNEIYNIKKELIIGLEQSKTKQFGRAFFNKTYVNNDNIYGTKPQINNGLRNNFKLTFETFHQLFQMEITNLLDTTHFIEIEKIKLQRPECLIISDKVIIQPDESVYSFDSTQLDKKAEFEGGEEKFNILVRNSIVLPNDEKFTGGKMHLSYIIEKDGSISNIKFYKDFGFDINKQIEKIISNSPKWKPAIIDKEPVKVKHFLYLNLHSDND